MQQVVLFHTHGLGRFDFSDIGADDLHAIDQLAAERRALLCPTIYLTQPRLAAFGALIGAFAEMKTSGQLTSILGFAIEGPVLGTKGGTPAGSVWRPTSTQWREIATWFPLGLKYVVIAPDILALEDDVDHALTFGELLTLIYESGGRVALGHFEGTSAIISALRLDEVLNHIEADFEPSPYLILTDHLFNDMPRSFRHAFRTPEERATRQSELDRHLSQAWRAPALSNLLGPVPSALLTAALEKRLTPSLNFDGGHVDLAICRRVVDYLGAERIIAITDHTETKSLAGEALSKDEHTHLLYRADGVLAASSVSHEQQCVNMQSIGMCQSAINLALYETPLAALRFEPCLR